MKVSILFPVYNAAKYIHASINSILAQTYTDFELIIINDGSSDKSEEIILTYNDERVRYIKQENKGVAISLNNALALASGTFIWRHDADDICEPDQLEAQMNFLINNSEYSLVATQIAFMTKRGKIASDYRQPAMAYFLDQYFVEVKRSHFNPYSPITHATILVKTSVLKNLGGYRIEFIISEDVDLWLRLIQKYKAAVLSKCGYYVRLNPASATNLYAGKADYYRNLAFKYFEQRAIKGRDDLQNGQNILLPEIEYDNHIVLLSPMGKNFRNDILSFRLPLARNAGDWLEFITLASIALKSGWRLPKTWKLIIIHLLSKNNQAKLLKLKNLIRW